jgi:phage terminase large subunit
VVEPFQLSAPALSDRYSGETLKFAESLRDLTLKYRFDAALFVSEMLGVEPDEKQREALDAVSKHRQRRVTIRSGHGVGKTAYLSWVIWWFLYTRFPQKTAVTAPSSGQLFDALWPEIGKWGAKLPPWMRELVEITGDRIRFKPGPERSFVTAKTSRAETPEAMAGVHEEHVLLIADEASGVPNAVFEAASGSLSSDNAIMIMTGNPVRSSGYFYDSHMRLPGWYRIHISCLDSKQVSRQYIEEKKIEYGEDSNAYRIRVLGEFPLADNVVVFVGVKIDREDFLAHANLPCTLLTAVADQ